MRIIKATENLTPTQVYNMTKGNDVRKLSDAEGETLDVMAFVIYEDTNTDGETMTVLSLETANGVRYATNSKTVIRNFTDIRSMFESMEQEPPTLFRISSGTSKNGRKYLCMDIG